MNETKVLAAILTIAASASDTRSTSSEVGKESWRKVIKTYDEILATLEQKQKS
jgi:hypothetical protein